MAIIKCEHNHFYDNTKFDKCPHCEKEAAEPVRDDEVTIAKISSEKMKKNLASFVASGDERTVGIFSSKGTFNPVVGWLVCTDGNEKGRDYRICSGRNFVGRAYKMDITISDDKEISRENHCSIVYEPKNSQFSIVPGSSISYLNDKEVIKPEIIKAYDNIKLGRTTLCFIPYCKEGVKW